ncbi:MAG TPA: 2-oxo-4-hydroxy-4-carboxy-5-ureidoimidazoline decarboxylase [Chthoniobacterales bacterium]|jgi:OHCU decarboxylase|nr:2-oxo-4-hydroxy-4-carboxy-5-ureidoimidazoline decarboxylase [Chthoniobacterales bacterium]
MLKLAEVNAMDREQFAQRIGPVFEHSPWIAARTAAARPFAAREELLAGLRLTVEQASEEEKVALIRAHPDLVGCASLTNESQAEQAAAGLDQLSTEEAAQFRDFNRRYREKFDFPFVVCARENKKEAILAAFPKRLQNSRAAEMQTALEEIFKIAALRLRDLVR